MRIAIDFDNTIVSYGTLFLTTAVLLGYVSGDGPSTKSSLRNYLRALPEGEVKWRHLQAEVYGHALACASPFSGVRRFLVVAKKTGAEVFIVSHKSQFATAGAQRIDLRKAAKEWLKQQDLLGPGLFSESDIYFLPTFDDKIACFTALNCTHVIDDLVEIFDAAAFPRQAKRLLFAPESRPERPLHSFQSWDELRQVLFPDDLATAV